MTIIQANNWTNSKDVVTLLCTVSSGLKEKLMIPVQYRDPETEEILDRKYEAEAPAIGQRVMLDGVWECEVLYRWRCVPTCCIAYVRPVRKRVLAAARAAA